MTKEQYWEIWWDYWWEIMFELADKEHYVPIANLKEGYMFGEDGLEYL